MLSPRQKTVRSGVAALAGALLVAPVPPAPSPSPVAVPGSAPAAREAAPSTAAPLFEGGDCLAATLCSLKSKVRSRKPAWTPERCRQVADGVLASARRHQLAPALLVAVMINESDLDENAARLSHTRNGVAKDSGLMGIRCVLGAGERCKNDLVRGMPWREVMDPVTNVELGARYLAHYRDAGKGRARCRHRDHAYWAHYNHGQRYLAHGQARHYPHNVAVLYYSLAQTLGWDTSEVATTQLTVRDPGTPARTADRPVGERYTKLCAAIRSSHPVCAASAALAAAPSPAATHL